MAKASLDYLNLNPQGESWMTRKKLKFIFTNHLRERFIQRTNSRYDHLKGCKDKECEECQKLKEEIKQKSIEEKREVDTQIIKRISNADENRSYVNNSGFMTWYYDKYGYDDKFQFLVHKNILFVVLIKRGRKIVVTCLDARTHLVGKATLQKKRYNKIPTKEEKRQSQLLEQIDNEAQSQ